MAFIETTALFLIILLILYKWSIATFDIFKKRGIAYDPPWPLIGNLDFNVLLNRTSSFNSLINQYLKYKDSKIIGVFNFRTPALFVTDPYLIKQIAIKHFDHFTNHNTTLLDNNESVISKSLIALKDHKWKKMRNTLTPTFTGSKMRQMFELVNACSVEGVRYLKDEIFRSGDKSEIELEIKEYFTRYANDVIATTAFGIDVNSFQDKDNTFFKIGKTMTQFSSFVLLKMLAIFILPKFITKILGLKIFDEQQIKYFNKLVLDSIKYREEHKIIRPDMIHLLMEAKRQQNEEAQKQGNSEEYFSDEDLLAQCLLFFFAGFETVSICLSFITYELLSNPEIQEELYEEIVVMERELDGKPLNYDALKRMKYLDMIVSETLRKWPPSIGLDRVCSADIDLKDDDDNLIVSLKKDDFLTISVLGSHHDADNFPEPMKFNPLRFSESNKDEIKPFTYMPFGVGVRNCIGNRLALMEVKSIIYHLVLHFKLQPSDKTVKNMADSIRGIQMKPKELFWVRFIPRNTTI